MRFPLILMLMLGLFAVLLWRSGVPMPDLVHKGLTAAPTFAQWAGLAVFVDPRGNIHVPAEAKIAGALVGAVDTSGNGDPALARRQSHLTINALCVSGSYLADVLCQITGGSNVLPAPLLASVGLYLVAVLCDPGRVSRSQILMVLAFLLFMMVVRSSAGPGLESSIKIPRFEEWFTV